MNTAQLSKVEIVQAIFNQSRNGCNDYIRHPFARRLIYTDGVQEVCEAAGSYWLLDVIGTEATPKLLAQFDTGAALGVIVMQVTGSKAVLTMTTADDAPPIWTRRIQHTNFPQGEWTFFLACDSLVDQSRMCTVLILPSEN